MILLLKFIIFLFPFFKPNYIIQIPLLNQIYNLTQILISIFIILEFIKKKKPSSNIVNILIMEVVIFISSIINELECIDVIKNIVQTMILCMMIESFAHQNLKKLFLSLKIILVVLVLIDFIFILKYPFGLRIGLYNIWFFGAKNGHITYILPLIFCTYIYNFCLNKSTAYRKIEFILLFLISIKILISVNSTTSIIVLITFIILMFISNNKIYSKISTKIINIIYIILFTSVILFQFQNNFSPIIENVFHKDITFTGRTEIWEKSIFFIKNKPILGYGLESSEIRVKKMNDISGLNCHNMLLEILYDGGIILFILFLNFWLKICKALDNYSQNNNQILKSIFVVYLVELFTEVFAFEILLWIFILIYETSYQMGNKEELRLCQEAQKV